MPFAPISLRFTDADRMAMDDEPSYYVHEHAGTVVLIEVDEDIVETPIGKFSASYVNVAAAINAGYPLNYVFDATQTILDMHSALYKGWELSPAAQRAGRLYSATEWTNVLYLDRLEIDEAWRGNRYGLAAMLGLMHHLQMGSGAVVLKAFPLDFEHGGANSGTGPEAFRKAQQRLMRYYKQVGFQRVGRSDYMIRGSDWPFPILTF